MTAIASKVLIGVLRNKPELKRELDPFLNYFDIVDGGKQSNQSNVIYYFTLKPNTKGTQILGDAKNILLLYTTLTKFRPIITDLAENIISNDPFNFDNLLFFVTGVGRDFEKSVLGLNNNTKMNRIVVPFLNDDLKFDHDGNDLFKRLRRSAINNDLFNIRQPIKSDDMFFGRTAIISEIRNKLRQSENIGIFGLRRMGKTSLTLKLERMMRSKQFELIFVNAEGPEIYSLRWWQLLELIAKKMGADVKSSYSESNGAKRFSSFVDSLGGDVQYIIVVDEIEHITPLNPNAPHWATDFIDMWKTIRAVHTRNRNIAFIISGVNGLVAEKPTFNNIDNPLFNWFIPQYMSGMSEEEIDIMVNSLGKYMGLKFTADACHYLNVRFGGHPMLIRIACSELHASFGKDYDIPKIVNKSHFEAISDKIDMELDSFFTQILYQIEKWYPEEFQMLIMLGKGDLKNYNEMAEEWPEYAYHLQRYNLVGHTGEIKIPSMKEAINRRARSLERKKQVETADEIPNPMEIELNKMASIGKIRNEFEILIKRLIKRHLKMQYGTQSWGQKIVDHQVSHDKKKLQGIDADTLLDEWLYLKDIKNILDKEWGRFTSLSASRKENSISKQDMLSFIDHLDNNRHDAHAKVVDETTLILTISSSQKILRILRELLSD